MSQSSLTDPRLDLVCAAAVRSYLLSRGWQPQDYPGPELLVFVGPNDDDGEPILQVLPATEHLRDYRIRLEELIASLSILENRPAADIVSDILQTAPPKEQPAPNGASQPLDPRPVP